jgi:hypothetical protein
VRWDRTSRRFDTDGPRRFLAFDKAKGQTIRKIYLPAQVDPQFGIVLIQKRDEKASLLV